MDKKLNSSRKLRLNKETVRKLNEAELGQVVGGTGSFLCHNSRASACCPCTYTSTPPTGPVMCPIK